jgi:hypothetical protein
MSYCKFDRYRYLWLSFYFWCIDCTALSAHNNVSLKLYNEKCSQLLKESEIRFAGIVDKDGNLIAGGFKEGLVPYEGDETRLHSFLEFVSKASIRKEYDESLGPINYIAARRDKAVLVSFPFPVTQILLLISAEPSANIENLAKKAVKIFTDVN